MTRGWILKKPCICIILQRVCIIRYLNKNSGWLPATFCPWNILSQCHPIISQHTETSLTLVPLFHGRNVLVWFRWGITCFKCRLGINIVQFVLSAISIKIRVSSLKVGFSAGFDTGNSSLRGTGLVAVAKPDISLCVWIWRLSLLFLLNKSNNQISGLLVLSKPSEWRKVIGANHLPILWEASKNDTQQFLGAKL